MKAFSSAQTASALILALLSHTIAQIPASATPSGLPVITFAAPPTTTVPATTIVSSVQFTPAGTGTVIPIVLQSSSIGPVLRTSLGTSISSIPSTFSTAVVSRTASTAPSSSPTPLSNSTTSTGLDSSAKIGIGVGVSLGVVLLIAICIAICYARRILHHVGGLPSRQSKKNVSIVTDITSDDDDIKNRPVMEAVYPVELHNDLKRKQSGPKEIGNTRKGRESDPVELPTHQSSTG